MKRKLFGFVGALVVLLAFVVLGGCKTDADGDKYDPVDITITLTNTTTGDEAAKITGVYITVDQTHYAQIGSGNATRTYPIGGEYTYDTTYTVDAGGTAVTLPAFKIPLNTGETTADNYAPCYIYVDISQTASNPVSYNTSTTIVYEIAAYNTSIPPAKLTLDLVFNASERKYELTKVN